MSVRVESRSLQTTGTYSGTTQAWSAVLADWKFLGGAIAIVLGVTSLPYLYGAVTSPSDREFIGLIYNVADIGQYFAWMRAFQSGFLISDTLTPEPNPPAFFNLIFWLLGRLALYSGLELPSVFQLFRLFSGCAFGIAVYYLCTIVLEGLWQRRIALIVILFGSGFSAFFVALNKVGVPIYFGSKYVAEGNSLFTIMAFPLLTFAMVLVSLVFAWMLRSYQEGDIKFAFAAGLAALVLGLSHGYDLILVLSVLAAFTLVVFFRDGVARHWLKSVSVVAIMSAVPSFYLLQLTRANPVWNEVLRQFSNAGVYSPNPLELALLLGAPFMIAIVTFDGLLPLNPRPAGELFIKVWFIVNFFLIYLPVDYQIHFINGFQIPISILATLGVFRFLLPHITSWTRALSERHLHPSPTILTGMLAAFLLFLVLPTNIYLVGWRVFDMQRHEPPYFLFRDEFAGMAWLRENARSQDVVLSSLQTGQYIPGFTGERAYLAHWANTLDYFRKRDSVGRFFDPAVSDAERRALIETFHVTYVYWGEGERTLGSWDPARASWLKPVWSSRNVTLFAVES